MFGVVVQLLHRPFTQAADRPISTFLRRIQKIGDEQFRLGASGDPDVVKKLVRLTADGNAAEAAVKALRVLLKGAVRQAPDDGLRAVSTLSTVSQFAGGNGAKTGKTTTAALTSKRIIDCEDIKELARTELGRRGVRA